MDWDEMFETFNQAFGVNGNRAVVRDGFISQEMFNDLLEEFTDAQYFAYVLTSNLV